MASSFLLSWLLCSAAARVSSAGEPARPMAPSPHAAQLSVSGPEWKPVEHGISLPFGSRVLYTFHYNRNALLTACPTKDGVLALAESGNLLRFDGKTLRLIREREDEVAIVALAEVPGLGVIVADAEGRVSRVEPETLRLTEVAKLDSVPNWLGGYLDAQNNKPQLLAFPTSRIRSEITLYHVVPGRVSSTTHTLPSIRPTAPINAVLLDREARLWLGRDLGEWGGEGYSIDVPSGRVRVLQDSPPAGIYGFVGLPNGQVLAYGGVSHFSSYSFIARVDRSKVELLAESADPVRKNISSLPQQLRGPISHIIPDTGGSGLLVFAYEDFFHVDSELKNWKHMGALQLRHHSGRPDAMGLYPAVRSIHVLKNGTNELLCATARDGLVRVANGKGTSYIVPNQFEGRWTSTVLPAAGGTAFDGIEPWQYAQGRWRQMAVDPPWLPPDNEQWSNHRLFLDDRRSLLAVNRTSFIPGFWAVMRVQGNRRDVLNPQPSNEVSWSTERVFATPDGKLWLPDSRTLWQFADGQWKAAGQSPETNPWRLKVVGSATPPWLLQGTDGFYRLHPGEVPDAAVLKQISFPKDAGDVYAAFEWTPGKILLATPAGLRLFDELAKKLIDPPFAAPKKRIRALGRDGLGRIWLAGDGIWLIDVAGKVHSFEKVAKKAGEVYDLGADSEHAGGVFLALSRGGVLQIRMEAAQ